MLFQLDLASAHRFLLSLLISIIVIVLSLVTIENGMISAATIVDSHHIRRIIVVREFKRLSVRLNLEALEAAKAAKYVKTSCFALALLTLE